MSKSLRTIVTLSALLTLLLLTSCIRTYKHDVQQGNIIDPDRLSRLEIGMSKNDVQSLLGTSMLQDSFHPDRWDYFYSLRKARKKDTEKKLLTLYFEEDQLVRMVGTITAADGDVKNPTKTVIIDERPAEGGVIQRGWDKVWK